MEKLVSIVLPIYNGEKYMRKSIQSVLDQSYKNWELLILDDCSTDRTSEIAKEYILVDSRIKYFKNEENLRLPRNLNKGFSLSKGEYLTWTSDDNMYKFDAIEKMVNALENSKAEFVYASCRIIDEDDKEIEYIMVNGNGNKQIVGSNPVGACFMYTRNVYEVIGDYDPKYTLVEDFDYWQRIFMKFEVTYITEILYYYRWHNGALTSTMKKDIFNQTLEKLLLKNRTGFGKIDMESKYYFYKGLYDCRKNLNDAKNPYIGKYKFYSLLFLLRYRLPNKMKREITKRKS